MIPLGLDSSDYQTLVKTMLDSHSVRTSIQVLTLEEEPLADLSGRVIGGQVDVDGAADISRGLSLDLLDTGGPLPFDSRGPHEAALYMDRMIQATYSVKCPFGWVDIPVFTGPITGVSQANDLIHVEAQSKEVMAMASAWQPMTFLKGVRKVEAMESMLRYRAGEVHFDFPAFAARSARDISLARQSKTWLTARRLACSMDAQLFYDGRGTARLRSIGRNPVFEFREGDGGSIMTKPEISYSVEEFHNVIWVRGEAVGSKEAISAWFAAPEDHPLSPERLGRNGVPRRLLEIVDDSTIQTQAQAEALAKGMLEDHLLEVVNTSFNSLPLPFLEPGDVCRLSTRDYSTSFRLLQFGIPLVVGEQMSVGYLRKFPLRGVVPLRTGAMRN